MLFSLKLTRNYACQSCHVLCYRQVLLTDCQFVSAIYRNSEYYRITVDTANPCTELTGSCPLLSLKGENDHNFKLINLIKSP